MFNPQGLGSIPSSGEPCCTGKSLTPMEAQLERLQKGIAVQKDIIDRLVNTLCELQPKNTDSTPTPPKPSLVAVRDCIQQAANDIDECNEWLANLNMLLRDELGDKKILHY